MTDSTAKAPQVDYVDLPDVPETFADSIHSIFFDGQTLRINFCVTSCPSERRLDAPPRVVASCCPLTRPWT